MLTIRDKDKEINRLNNKIRRVTKKNQDMGQNFLMLKQKRHEAETDLRKLVKNRQDYTSIQETVSQISQRTISTSKRSKNVSPKTTGPNWYKALNKKW